jgi:hypothetical protein
MNHDPPDDTIEPVISSAVMIRSFEWWETTKHISKNDDLFQQPLYEDD